MADFTLDRVHINLQKRLSDAEAKLARYEAAMAALKDQLFGYVVYFDDEQWHVHKGSGGCLAHGPDFLTAVEQATRRC